SRADRAGAARQICRTACGTALASLGPGLRIVDPGRSHVPPLRDESAGLAGSSLLFGLAHLPAWAAASHAGTLLFALVILLNGLGGLLFGWVYWRWGLPYAILSIFPGMGAVKGLGPGFLPDAIGAPSSMCYYLHYHGTMDP